MTDDVEWVEAPPAPKRGNATPSRFSLLAERPGEWAAFRCASQSQASGAGQSIRRSADARGAAVETTSRSNGDGTWTLYARVVPS